MFTKAILVPLSLVCSAFKGPDSGSFCGTFPGQGIFENQLLFLNFVSVLVPLKNEKKFKPQPQDRILVHLQFRSFVQNF